MLTKWTNKIRDLSRSSSAFLQEHALLEMSSVLSPATHTVDDLTLLTVVRRARRIAATTIVKSQWHENKSLTPHDLCLAANIATNFHRQALFLPVCDDQAQILTSMPLDESNYFDMLMELLVMHSQDCEASLTRAALELYRLECADDCSSLILEPKVATIRKKTFIATRAIESEKIRRENWLQSRAPSPTVQVEQNQVYNQEDDENAYSKILERKVVEQDNELSELRVQQQMHQQLQQQSEQQQQQLQDNMQNSEQQAAQLEAENAKLQEEVASFQEQQQQQQLRVEKQMNKMAELEAKLAAAQRTNADERDSSVVVQTKLTIMLNDEKLKNESLEKQVEDLTEAVKNNKPHNRSFSFGGSSDSSYEPHEEVGRGVEGGGGGGGAPPHKKKKHFF